VSWKRRLSEEKIAREELTAENDKVRKAQIQLQEQQTSNYIAGPAEAVPVPVPVPV
jgi:hypothetical protein